MNSGYLDFFNFLLAVFSTLKDHPAIKLLDDLTTLSAAEIELQKKTEILNNLKVELIQLLQNQREKDLRYVEMEETLDKAELNRSLEDHLQLKVRCFSIYGRIYPLRRARCTL